jgi:hypothetical protein
MDRFVVFVFHHHQAEEQADTALVEKGLDLPNGLPRLIRRIVELRGEVLDLRISDASIGANSALRGL